MSLCEYSALGSRVVWPSRLSQELPGRRAPARADQHSGCHTVCAQAATQSALRLPHSLRSGCHTVCAQAASQSALRLPHSQRADQRPGCHTVCCGQAGQARLGTGRVRPRRLRQSAVTAHEAVCPTHDGPTGSPRIEWPARAGSSGERRRCLAVISCKNNSGLCRLNTPVYQRRPRPPPPTAPSNSPPPRAGSTGRTARPPLPRGRRMNTIRIGNRCAGRLPGRTWRHCRRCRTGSRVSTSAVRVKHSSILREKDYSFLFRQKSN